MLRIDLFTCDRATFDRWCEAVMASDAFARGNLEIGMPGFASLQGADVADLGLLLAALAGLPTDAACACAHDAVEPVATPLNDPGRGSLVVTLRDHVVRTFGETPLGDDPGLHEVWCALADSYHEVDDSAAYLTADAAARIGAVCRGACGAAQGVYAHAYVDPFHGRGSLAARPEGLTTHSLEATRKREAQETGHDA
jgi:hypothetical protein